MGDSLLKLILFIVLAIWVVKNTPAFKGLTDLMQANKTVLEESIKEGTGRGLAASANVKTKAAQK